MMYVHSQEVINALMLSQREPCADQWHGTQHALVEYSINTRLTAFDLKKLSKSKFGHTIA